MNHPLAKLKQKACEIAEKVATSSSQQTWQLKGKDGSGKSTVLRQMRSVLKGNDCHPIYLNPPHRALDTGGVALVQFVSSIFEQGLVDDSKLSPLGNCPWHEQLKSTSSLLRDIEVQAQNGKSVVLLIDEPDLWEVNSDEDDYFARHCREVRQLFLTARCHKVIAGESKDLVTLRQEEISVDIDLHNWLESQESWGSLADSARELKELKENLCYPPIYVRILVALSNLIGKRDTLAVLKKPPTRRELTGRLIQAIQDEGLEKVLQSWGKFALVRTPLPAEWVETETSGWNSREKDLLTKGILYREGQKYFLHDMLRLDAREKNYWQNGESLDSTHKKIADYYESIDHSKYFGFSFPPPTQLYRKQVEGFYHLAEAGDPCALEKFMPLFSDQLCHLGRSLSLKNKYKEAANIFQMAISWEENSDYAHHYLAYNLDVQGIEASRVEQHYQKALEIVENHPWWHSRWICYLITRGRTEAAKKAWSEAQDQLGLPDKNARVSIYNHLHLWVARLALHRGLLDFAEKVLQGIPNHIRKNDSGFAAMESFLKGLREAEKREVVFPAHISPEKWWDEAPFLLPKTYQSQKRKRWFAGHIESIDEDALHLVLGTKKNGQPQFLRMHPPREKFDNWLEGDYEYKTGQFFELGEYENREAPLLRFHFVDQFEDYLPPLFPDPVRYLRKVNMVK